jgi:hypothetical protein
VACLADNGCAAGETCDLATHGCTAGERSDLNMKAGRREEKIHGLPAFM